MKTQRALKECAEWLAYCLKLGWSKASLDRLEALWWKYHDEAGRLIIIALLLLSFPVLSLAQQPQPLQIVSNCVKGVYDECQFVPPHWYYLKNGIWTRDDGVVGKPPVVPVVPCPVDTGKLNQQLLKDLDYRGPLKTNDSPWNLNAKLSVFAFTATASLDCWSTGNLRENNGLLRNGHGKVNQAACFGLNGGTLALTMILQKKYPRGMTLLRWFGAGGHAGAVVWSRRQQ